MICRSEKNSTNPDELEQVTEIRTEAEHPASTATIETP
jgi:hypothetical protein